MTSGRLSSSLWQPAKAITPATRFQLGCPGAGDYGPINEMFPLAPVERHKGWILGAERIVTAVSGTFPWRRERRPDVLVFDTTGRRVPANANVARAPSGWTVTLRLQDWRSIAVVR